MRAVAFSTSSLLISSKSDSGSSYRVHSPSRLSTPTPPRRPISIAVAGLTTPSMAEAMRGSPNLNASISQVMSTSSGSRVRRLGTMAMSSKPYARRPDLPIPISTSAIADPFARIRRDYPGGGMAEKDHKGPTPLERENSSPWGSVKSPDRRPMEAPHRARPSVRFPHSNHAFP